eukprot:4098824-Prorocentrum_lima.AAC.1
MTSSLVGSEMCIRDRYGGVTHHPEQMEETQGSRASCNTAGSLSDPVSYTHLTLPTICSV